MVERKNVIFVIIDAARYYPGEASDNAGRPEIFERLARESCYFTKAVSTAPSTVMSFSSIFTGFPAGYLARNFNDFKFDNNTFKSLQAVLKDNGYNIYSMTYFPGGREFLKNIIFPVNESYWPGDLKGNENWPNEAIDRIFDNVINKGIETPFCLFLHYNVRWDRSITERVQTSLDKMKELDLYDDSLLIMCSDHGLPDPKRKIPRHIMRDLGHDLIVTDDNIRIPLCIKYPHGKAKVIDNLVCTLDLMPTVLDYAGIVYKNSMEFPIWGKSLIPLITGNDGTISAVYDDRFIRTECRYLAQPNRITSLRGKDHKFVYYYDESIDDKEYFFDLLNDPEESTNLVKSEAPDVQMLLQRYRDKFWEEDRRAEEFHNRYLCEEFKKNCRYYLSEPGDFSDGKVVVLCTYSLSFISILADAVKSMYSKRETFLISNVDRGMEEMVKKFDVVKNVDVEYTKINFSNIIRNGLFEEKTLIIVPLDDGKPLNYYKDLYSVVKSISKGKLIFVDCNMDIYLEPKRRNIPFGSNPDIPLFIRKIYKKIGFYYYRRNWYWDDLKFYIKKILPFLNLKVNRTE